MTSVPTEAVELGEKKGISWADMVRGGNKKDEPILLNPIHLHLELVGSFLKSKRSGKIGLKLFEEDCGDKGGVCNTGKVLGA